MQDSYMLEHSYKVLAIYSKDDIRTNGLHLHHLMYSNTIHKQTLYIEIL